MTQIQVKRRPWHGIIPENEIDIYQKAGWGAPAGIGKRAALLVIDVQYRSMGYAPMPIEQAIESMPTSCGEHGWQAVPHIARLLDVFHEMGAPVIYPYVAPKQSHDRGQFESKVPKVMSVAPSDYDFVKEVSPKAGDIQIPKFQASAFHGTGLASYLVGRSIDTLVVTGCTTSGCVRATVVDGCALNYKVVVPQDAVYDRSQVSHAVNLFDMASKYADVMPTDDLVTLLRALK